MTAADPAVPTPQRSNKGAGAFSGFEWMMAARYLGSRRRDSYVSAISVISLLGIMLGVAVLIIVMGVMNGFRAELLNRLLGVDGHIYVEARFGNLNEYDEWIDRITAVPGVVSAAPVVEGQVLASSNVATGGALVRGMRREDLAQLSFVADNIQQGSMAAFEGGHAIAVGSRLARAHGLLAGDRLTLISPQGDVTPFGMTPRTKSYRIAMVFEVGMSEYDASLVYMPLAEAQLFFGTRDGINKIEVRVDNPDQVQRYREDVAVAIGVDARVEDWMQLRSAFVGALQLERVVMFIILTMIILVAALNVVSGLIMLAKDKGRGIAVLRTMGATQGMVMRIFLIAGARIGVMGTVLGVALGILVAENIEYVRQFVMWVTGATIFDPEIYFLSQLVAEVNNGEVAAVVIVALTLSLLAPLYPAWRAARLDPVEALRYE